MAFPKYIDPLLVICEKPMLDISRHRSCKSDGIEVIPGSDLIKRGEKQETSIKSIAPLGDIQVMSGILIMTFRFVPVNISLLSAGP